ncbi:MAG: LPS export ABC transporter periplasmic protein LptC [Sporocytophaga sp.]|uniref:LPS export ABC transporter periplasmic protein LptC n=1 Tax=Sporocytophaga sp. TaxID=2231183 RepID=UPI001B127256|nr:LPS export ABC transporter periplasmic protein LptC [Sporocytophaga sp.]MBO9701514.1 LPS export ABC transporter periplasmic protein LptC [Sporocytophaga sp.]
MRKVFLFLTATVILFSCQQAKTYEQLKPYDGPVMEVNDIETIYSDSSVVRVRLKAPKELELQNGDKLFPKGVFIEFFDKKGVKTSTLRGNSGKLEKEKNLYNVKGAVEIKSIEQQKKMNSEELFWDPGKDEVYCDTNTFVTITTPTEILMGRGLKTNQNFTSYKILHPTGVIDVTE